MDFAEYLKAMFWAMVPLILLLPLAIAIERRWSHTPCAMRDRLPGAFLVVLTPALVAALSWPLSQAWRALGAPPLVSIAGLPLAARFVILLLIFDFLRYWEHRFEHRFWWPVHAVHHAPTELHAAHSASHPLLAFPELLLVTVPFSLIDPGGIAAPAMVWTFVAFQNIVIHSPLRLHAGPWRSLYVDSRYHRIHHSLEERHWHRNFGYVFSFWDKVFGTAHPVADGDWPAVGVPGVAPTLHPVGFLTQPFHLWRERRAERRGVRAANRDFSVPFESI